MTRSMAHCAGVLESTSELLCDMPFKLRWYTSRLEFVVDSGYELKPIRLKG